MKPAAGQWRVARAADHAAAGLATAMVLGLAAWALLRGPVLPAGTDNGPVSLRWLMPLPAVPPPAMPAPLALPGPSMAPAPGTAQVLLPSSPGVRPPRSGRPPASHVAAQPAGTPLFDASGRARLPEAVTAGTVDGRSQAERVFERVEVDPRVHPDRGLFERDLVAGTRQGRAERWLYGRDVQAARAREAPEVAWNPALHERPEDLAAADGAQPWLAAPISDEPAPGREGQASAALQARVAAVQAALAHCQRQPAALQALAGYLAALRRAESRWTQGSSPEERRHTLPAEIRRQYNLARRALWQLERDGADCDR